MEITTPQRLEFTANKNDWSVQAADPEDECSIAGNSELTGLSVAV